jgi:hypothetical protein
MVTQSVDTSPEAERMLVQLLQKAGEERRLAQACSLTASVRRLSWDNLARLHPAWSLRERIGFFVEVIYGKELGQSFGRWFATSGVEVKTDMNEELLAVVLPIVEVLEKLNVPYLVGGSVASSLHGIPRSTNDCDMVADIKETQIGDFVSDLQDRYYLSEEAIRSAIRQQSSFNLIHLETMLKVDIFVLKNADFEQITFSRQQSVQIEKAQRAFNFYQPEDIALHKLVWYDAGGRMSEKQWLDILGIFKVQAANLDKAYIEEWGQLLGLADLVQKAFEDAGI